jgi:hypothetical protein
MKKLFLVPIILLQIGCASDNYYYHNNKKIYLTPVNSYSRALHNTDYYINDNGTTLGVSDKILLKLTTNGNINDVLTQYNLTLEKQLGTSLYLVKVSNKDLTINTANRLTEDKNIVYAQPDFIKQKINR